MSVFSGGPSIYQSLSTDGDDSSSKIWGKFCIDSELIISSNATQPIRTFSSNLDREPSNLNFRYLTCPSACFVLQCGDFCTT